MAAKGFADLKPMGDCLEGDQNDQSEEIQTEPQWEYSWTITKKRNATRVAVVGSGVAGLAAAKYLLAEREKDTTTKHFEVTVFERHSEVAGIWNLTSPNDKFQTPIYDGLETNVPRTLMTYKDFPYPEDVSLFPTCAKIKQYLESYLNDIRDCIKLNSEVIGVAKVTKDYRQKWKVDVANTVEGPNVQAEHFFDAVVIATGTFDKSYIPLDLDWDDWEKTCPGSVIHSGDFRKAQDFKGKKVLMIRGGPSYFDIAGRISPYVKGDILVSTKKPLPLLSSQNQRNLSTVKHLLPEKREVSFVGGAVEYDIDIIMLCTGYQYEYKFLPKLQVSEHGRRLCGLWDQMFWITDRTLAFVGLPRMGTTFTVAEAQSAYIARALAGRLSLPSRHTMQQELEDISGAATEPERAACAAADGFHNFKYPKDKDYISRLSDASHAADREGNCGKQPPRFDAYLVWTRDNLVAMRVEFLAKGDERHRYPSPESLGFSEIPTPQ